MDTIVSVIVPVHRGLELTRRCLTSVLSAAQRTKFELIVIDDATPEHPLAELLDELAAADRRVRLIRHDTNMGFVASVNEAMALSTARDVVLLNSDTEVAGDWLDRLRRCAYSAEDVATVTPFSNNATICSYPRIVARNALPDGLTVAALDALFQSANSGLFVEVPTGVGFCLYIPSRSRAAVGEFDEQRFGLGYGEEVDFCMRARRLGLRNLLCADTFVFHRGGVSFLEQSGERETRAQAIIDKDFPEFPELVRDFIARDPARPLRRAVDLARLAGTQLACILFVSHNWGGGVARHINDLAAAVAGRAQVLLLQPHQSNLHVLRWLAPGEEFQVYYDLTHDLPALLDFLAALGVSRVHYHHLLGMPSTVLDLAQRLGVPYDCTLHDYFAVCPQFHFVDASGGYCGEPGPQLCEQCLTGRPPQWDLSIGQWRDTFLTWLSQADRVIAPSHDVAVRMTKYAADLPLIEWPHLEPDSATALKLTGDSVTVRRILILGSLSDAKGLRLVSECARHAKEEGIGLHFRVIGSLSRSVPTWPQSNLSVFGEYDDDRLADILRLERPDAFLFASVIPETYSYTLTVAMRTGLPIVASAIGAFPERLADYPSSILLDPTQPIQDWVRALSSLSFAYPGSVPSRTKQPLSRVTSPQAYADAYLAPVQPFARTHEAPALPSWHFYFPEGRRLASPPIERLYEEGVLCGKREAREQLHRDATTATARLREQQAALVQRDAHLAELKRALSQLQCAFSEKEAAVLVREGQVRDLEREVRELKQSLRDFDTAHNRHVAHLENTVDGLRRRIAELEGSTFWRASAPLRWSVHQLKRVSRGVKAAPTTLPRAAALARRIVAEEGVRGLVDETRRRAQVGREGPSTELPPDIYRAESEIGALDIPSHPEPEVTIVVPTYGQHRVTFTCLKSIADNTGALAYEVLLVDDHYPEPAGEALAAVTGLRIVRNDENLGFLRSCNRAAAQALGRYLVLLNNDTLVLPGWLEALLRTAKGGVDVGAVGAKLIYPNGRLQEAGGIVWKDGSAWNWGRGEDAEDPRFQYVRQVDYCSAACLLIPKALFDEIGGFDERYVPAYYEDTDICFALRARGKRVLYQPAAQAVHFEGVSHGTDEAAGLKAYQVRNRDIFRDKWAAQLSSHLANGVMPERERDRGAGLRVLWVEACMLTPDQDSGSLRTWRLLEILRELNCKVAFVADNLEHAQPYTHDLQQLGIEVLHHPYLSSVESYLRSHARDHDVIVLCRHYVANRYVGLIRELAPGVRIVFDTIDLHYLRLRRKADLDGQPASRRAADIAFREELDIVAKSDATLVVSSDEVKVLAREAPQAHVHIVSNVHEPAARVAPAAGRRDLLFVGGFQHPPNLDAIEYYASDIWPLIRQRHPEARTLVVGSRMPETLRRLGTAAGLDMLGFVPDMTAVLSSCRLSVSPLRYGAGVKGKINQSMSAGLPVVATPPSVEGMFLTDGEDVLVADTAIAFADAVSRLYTDDALWERLSMNGQDNVRKHFSTDTARQALARLLRDVGLPADANVIRSGENACGAWAAAKQHDDRCQGGPAPPSSAGRAA